MKQSRKNITCIFFVAAIMLFLLCSCKTKTIYVPVETIRTEYRDRYWQDSVYLYDSVYIRTKGDTIYIDKYKYHYKYKYKTDSIYIKDSIQVPYPVIEVKEVNKLYKWQKGLMLIGLLSVGTFIGWAIYKLRN